MVRLLSADRLRASLIRLLAGDRCPCLRQSSLEAVSGSDDVSEQLLNDGTEYRARLRPLKVEGDHVLLMVRPIDEQEAVEEDLVYTDVLTSVRNRRYYEEKLRSARMNAGVAAIDLDTRVFNDTCGPSCRRPCARCCGDSHTQRNSFDRRACTLWLRQVCGRHAQYSLR